MDSSSIRAQFLKFFEQKNHKIVPSAPLVIHDDPSLMFTNAGMNQFKDYFLGNKHAKHLRVADTQKCLRVSGKHNDLEEVGHDTYHHTFFEMLGNWSFGDYFKEEAIAWAWELLTEVYNLPKDQLYVTVFEGDEKDQLPFDHEAFDFWKQWLPEERILSGSKKDNFWEMGDTGPCGPCSEIHIDLRPAEDRMKSPGKDWVNQDHPQVVEIWNLVFMQFNRMSDGSLKDLPAKHVDTGMGFERLAMAVQNKQSNYDTDVFQPLIQWVAQRAGVKYGASDQSDIAIRVISDHIRAICFSIADGQLPSNVRAGYVIRRILRRAVRYGFTFLDFKEPFLCKMVPLLANQFKETFPELAEQQEFVARVIRQEESNFLKTLDNGLKRIEQLKLIKGDRIEGKLAFELFDTYGFPLDLTALIARERGLTVDEVGFQQEMKAQKERSQKASKQSKGDWISVVEETEVNFVGYDQLSTTANLIRYREVEEKGNKYYQLVFDRTPFYAESGGQVGDKGLISNESGKIPVFDTRKENDLVIHFTDHLPAQLDQAFQLTVDREKRRKTTKNHSATHLLHAALREVLGDHVQQKGSMVNDLLLRFDFSHFSKMTQEEIQNVERIVNEKIAENIAKDEKRSVALAEAKEMGAMALFGEKYGDFVRVITFDQDFSVELCGGTHVKATGEIGFFKIINESSVAAGVRRIEALTGEGANEYVNIHLEELQEIKNLLKVGKDLPKVIQSLLDEKHRLQKDLEQLQLKESGKLKGKLIKEIHPVNGVNTIIAKVQLPNAEALKKLAFELRNEVENLYLVLAAEIDGKPQIAVMASDDVVGKFNLHAGQIVKDLAKDIQGGGGGQPFFATAGGKNVEGLNQVKVKALDMAEGFFKSQS